MLNGNTMVKVTNISGAPTGYSLPELNVVREFSNNESKNISVKELRALRYIPGGLVLMQDYLFIDNVELLAEFDVEVQPEHSWTDEDIKAVLTTGNLDALKDALEFGPKGVAERIKDLAVSLEINDMSKRQAIKEFTGFDVNKAIEIKQIEKETEEEKVESKPATRRTASSDKGVRRIQTDYKVTS